MSTTTRENLEINGLFQKSLKRKKDQHLLDKLYFINSSQKCSPLEKTDVFSSKHIIKYFLKMSVQSEVCMKIAGLNYNLH